MDENSNCNIDDEMSFLENYSSDKYSKPSVTVDMLVFTVMDEIKKNYRKLAEKSLKILMIKRAEHPYKNQWALPGGFVKITESVDEAAIRELESETNVSNIYMEQLYTWGNVDRDPRTRVISCSYLALLDNNNLKIKAGDDAKEVKWFSIRSKKVDEDERRDEKAIYKSNTILLELYSEDEKISSLIKIEEVKEVKEGKLKKINRSIIQNNGISFDHSIMIQYALERLRNKIEYTNIAFNLMPDLFTLTELQKVYEIILDKELLAAAFRRKIAPIVQETEHFTKDAGHRPSKLFKFKFE